MVYRLESKKAIRRVKKIGNAHIFEAVVSRARRSGAWSTNSSPSSAAAASRSSRT